MKAAPPNPVGFQIDGRSLAEPLELLPKCGSASGFCAAPLAHRSVTEELFVGDFPSEAPAPVDAGGVLMLEDNSSFSEVIQDFLVESGYAVTSVRSGVEGVKAVLACDFAVILCDMMMPGLPGDLFYRAVERARPQLCDRFVFMTGYRGDATANEFLGSRSGPVLMKPFHLDELLDAIGFIEIRRQLFDSSVRRPLDGTKHSIPHPAVGSPTRKAFPPSKAGIAGPARKAHPRTVAGGSAPQATRMPTKVKPRRGRARSFAVAFVLGLLLFFVVAAFLAGSFVDLRQRVAVSSFELSTLEGHWADLSVQLQEAETAGAELESELKLSKQIREDLDAPGLTPVLREVAMAMGSEVELQSIYVRAMGDELGAWELRIGGVCTGQNPRMDADWLRQRLDARLGEQFGRDRVATRFERLEDGVLSPSTLPDQGRSAFTIIATANWKKPIAKPGGMERR